MADNALRILMIEDDPDYVEIIRLCLDEPDAMGMRFTLERSDRLEPGPELWSSLVPLHPYTWSVEAFDEDDRALAASPDQTFTYAPER